MSDMDDILVCMSTSSYLACCNLRHVDSHYMLCYNTGARLKFSSRLRAASIMVVLSRVMLTSL